MNNPEETSESELKKVKSNAKKWFAHLPGKNRPLHMLCIAIKLKCGLEDLALTNHEEFVIRSPRMHACLDLVKKHL